MYALDLSFSDPLFVYLIHDLSADASTLLAVPIHTFFSSSFTHIVTPSPFPLRTYLHTGHRHTYIYLTIHRRRQERITMTYYATRLSNRQPGRARMMMMTVLLLVFLMIAVVQGKRGGGDGQRHLQQEQEQLEENQSPRPSTSSSLVSTDSPSFLLLLLLYLNPSLSSSSCLIITPTTTIHRRGKEQRK